MNMSYLSALVISFRYKTQCLPEFVFLFTIFDFTQPFVSLCKHRPVQRKKNIFLVMEYFTHT